VVPLIFSQVVVAIMGTERLGNLGAKTLVLFLAMLLAAWLIALITTAPLVALYPVDRESVAVLRAGVSMPAGTGAAGQSGMAVGQPLLGFIPPGLVRFFMGGNPLPLLLTAVAFALVARWFGGDRREPIQRNFQRLSDATIRVVGWILLAAPVGVLALAFGLAWSTGGRALSLLTAFVLIISGVTLFITALLYPVTAVLGRISVRQFARAVAPAQLVAASTRSSLAALPALVKGGRERLGLPAAATGFVIPFAIATVKVSRMITTTVTLLFLAHAFELPLGASRIIVFSATMLLLSFVVAGLPGRGPEVNLLPAYLAAGVPLEGVVILETVDAIPDIFKTIVNVTSTLSIAAIVAPRPRPREIT
jgi:Na+/H+-dicarboxylate symporter